MPTPRLPGFITLLSLMTACGGEQVTDPGTTDPGIGGAVSVGGQGSGGGGAGTGITPGGTAGTGASTSNVGGASGGSVSTMPPECLVDWGTAGSTGTTVGAAGSGSAAGVSSDAMMMPIAGVTINIVNSSPSTLYLQNNANCQLDLKIYSCLDGFLNPIDYVPGCMASCAAGGNACVDCSACPAMPLVQPPGSITTVSWYGSIYTTSYPPNGCACYNQTLAPVGMYRAELTIYADSTLGIASRVVSTDFFYQGGGNYITLSL